jgi:hypothetical protein
MCMLTGRNGLAHECDVKVQGDTTHDLREGMVSMKRCNKHFNLIIPLSADYL